MKRTTQNFFLATLFAAFLTGCASAPPVPKPQAAPPVAATLPTAAFRPAHSIVRSVRGEITYAVAGNAGRLRVNLELPPGVIIQTKEASEAYLQVNGFTSTIKIMENSSLEITTMGSHRSATGFDTDTILTLKQGTILGSVRKLSANSSYEIHTPHGIASIRGTDFSVTVTPLPKDESKVTYVCVTGQLVVSAEVAGAAVTKTLSTGETWTPGEGDVVILTPPVVMGDPLPGGLALVIVAQPIAPGVLQQPFNGAGAPNPAVDVGRNPYLQNQPPTVHPIISQPPVVHTFSPPPVTMAVHH